jgi:alkyldihydroxyacetonephosphate synthase
MAHLSHVYVDGASLYVTYVYRRTADPDETLERWRRLKAAASRLISAHGGTISHQHGVGVDHAPYMDAEKGRLGLETIAAAVRAVDPEQRLNPGKLLPDDGASTE